MRTRPCRGPLFIAMLIFGILGGCGKAETKTELGNVPASPRRADSHELMLEVLDRIKMRAPWENIFLGDKDLQGLRKQLQDLPQDALARRGSLMFEIGTRDVFLGNTAEGIGEQETALEMLSQFGLQDKEIDRFEFALGVSHLRMAENQNCIESHTGESCLFPIRGGGIHVNKQGASRAIEYFASVLERTPDHLPSQWLLNLAYMAIGGYPDQVPKDQLIPPEAFQSEEDFPRFVDRAPGLGLNTFSLAGGCIVDDFDGDGLLDIVVSSWGLADQIRYFHNGGDGTFVDQTIEAGLTGFYGGLNLVQADYDNDSDVDVLVLRGGWLGESGLHPNSLLRNDGEGHFRDVTFNAGLAKHRYPTQTASWADYDNDGDLDLYVGNEGFPNELFQNQSDGTFKEVAAMASVNDSGFTKGVAWGDYDDDRLPDLYVSNMDGANRLYHNEGGGRFVDVAAQLGVTRPHVSFPLWFWDFNNDGALDLFVASFHQSLEFVAADYLGLPHGSEMDCLYQGDGRGGFLEVAAQQNLRHVTQPMGSNFGDLDNDGFLDFYLGTGFPEFEALVPNLMFHNHQGTGFRDVSAAGGFGHLQKGHGVAFADLDNDGDQDIFHELGGWFAGDAYGNALFENPGFGNHWITIKLIGTESNTSAIGTKIKIDIDAQGSKRSIYRWVGSGGSFGGNPFRQEIGVGSAEIIGRLEVFWPTSGKTQAFTDLKVDRFIEITEGDSEIRELPLEPMTFSQQPHSHEHAHHESRSSHGRTFTQP